MTTPALSLIGADLIRALAALPSVDNAVRERAEALARAIAADGLVTRVLRHGAGDYVVTAAGEGLFAREFGSVAAAAEPAIGSAIARMARGEP